MVVTVAARRYRHDPTTLFAALEAHAPDAGTRESGSEAGFFQFRLANPAGQAAFPLLKLDYRKRVSAFLLKGRKAKACEADQHHRPSRDFRN
jgi:hypothetical protein